ncbi:hypothetical protein [Maribellus mangrovi]|uniref:hypothetical protein n=1 Tax=Maribellus mangrovi TaxID=3133146 RepID=UPI0030EF9AC9
MKKLFLSLLMTAILGTSFGQVFQVPERTVEQKFNRNLYMVYVMAAVGINQAKESGMTVEEYGEKIGDLFKLSWNKEQGFTGLVNGILFNLESSRLAQDPPIEIVEQNENKMVFDWKPSYKELFSDGPLYDISYEEFSLWWNIVDIQIAEYLGATYKQEELDNDMLRITLTKLE